MPEIPNCVLLTFGIFIRVPEKSITNDVIGAFHVVLQSSVFLCTLPSILFSQIENKTVDFLVEL